MSYRRRFQIALFTATLSLSAVTGANSPWSEEKTKRADWDGESRVLKDIPQFVLDYAPLVHLYPQERFWPSDISEHLEHITPCLNDTKEDHHPTVDDLGDLNNLDGDGGRWVYLKSNYEIDIWRDENIKDLPPWLVSEHNIPVSENIEGGDEGGEGLLGEETYSYNVAVKDDRNAWFKVGPQTTIQPDPLPDTRNERRSHPPIKSSSPGGKSSAPAVLIVVEKDEGVVDAFWFYFYSYNLGNSVFSFRFGNHVGDWEHSVVRFYHGVPKAVFLSEHQAGKAYTYHAMEKIGKRPVIYSATGTHAMYATPGVQDYVLPFRILRDTTGRGPLWDPTLNMYSYHYNTSLASGHDRSIRSLDPLIHTLSPSTLTPFAPTSWFYYRGHWGDKFYPSSDPRQYALGSERAYVSGPVGPRFKALGRRTVCPDEDRCALKDCIAPRHWALRLLIDYLYATAIAWLIIGVVVVCYCCCCRGCCRRCRRRMRGEYRKWKVEGDVEGQVRVPREDDGLLAGDELAEEALLVVDEDEREVEDEVAVRGDRDRD